MPDKEIIPSKKFKETVVCFFENLCEIMYDMIEDGEKLSVGPKQIKVTASFAKMYDENKMIDSFIESHKEWIHIKNKNVNYLVNDLPKIYNKLPFNADVLTIPAKKYFEWEKSGHYKNCTKKEDWPVRPEDIDDYWTYIRSMIKISCQHIHLSREPVIKNGIITYYNKSAYSNFPLAQYVEEFEVKLSN